MNRKGFASIILITFVSVVIIISVYFLFFKEKCVLKESDLYVCGNNFSSFINSFRKPVLVNPTQIPDVNPTSPSSLPTSCVDQHETKAVITSLSSYSGSVGTKLEIRGCNFAGFEGGENAWIENSQGVKGVLYGEQGSTAKMIKVTLKSPLCSQDNSYSGLPCSSYLTLAPGIYKIWTMPWGANTKSNLATFMIQ